MYGLLDFNLLIVHHLVPTFVMDDSFTAMLDAKGRRCNTKYLVCT